MLLLSKKYKIRLREVCLILKAGIVFEFIFLASWPLEGKCVAMVMVTLKDFYHALTKAKN
jgi:hypothetical protein